MRSAPRQFLICVIVFCITVNLSTVESKRYGKKKEKIAVLEDEPASVVEAPEVTLIEASSKTVPKQVNLSKAVEVSSRPIFVSASKAEEAVDYPSSGYPVKIPAPHPAPAPYSVPAEESKLESVDYASSIPPAFTEEYVYPVVPVKEVVVAKPDLQVANSLHYGGPIGYGGYGYGGGIGYPVFKYPRVHHHVSYKNFGKRFGFFNKWTGRGLGVGYGFGSHHHGYAAPGYKQFNGGFHKTFHFFG